MSCAYNLLSIVDGFLCLFVFFPLAILHWRGTWGLQDVYFFPGNEALSSWTSFAVGTVGCIFLQFVQPFIFTYITPSQKCLYVLVSRFYLYISGWVVMCYWRGVWDAMDYYLTEHWVNSTVILAVTLVLTWMSRMFRNNVGLPFSIALDSNEELLMSDTVFKVKSAHKGKYFLDVCFTQLVVVTANICVWRGIWNVLDAFFFPEDKMLSDVGSLALGYLLCIQLLMLQWPAGVTSAYLDDYHIVYKIIFEDVVMFVALWATLLLWRGAWDLCVEYVIPDPLIGGWVCHWVGTIGLILLQAFNSVAMNGIERDGEALNGEGIFPTKYLRLIFAEKLKLKVPEEDYLIESADTAEISSPYSGSDSCLSDEDINIHTLTNGKVRQNGKNPSSANRSASRKTKRNGNVKSYNNNGYNSFSSVGSEDESCA